MNNCSHRDSALPVALLVSYADYALVGDPWQVALAAGVLLWRSASWPDYDHHMHSRLHPGAIIVGGFARRMAGTKTGKDRERADVHRGASHSIGGVAYLGLLTALVALWIPLLAPWWWLWAVSVMLGSVVHIAGDCLTPSGCPIFWPFKVDGRRFHRHTLDVLTTGDDIEEPVVATIVFRPTTLLVGLWITGLLDVAARAFVGDARYGVLLIALGWSLVVVVVLLIVRTLHQLRRWSRGRPAYR